MKQSLKVFILFLLTAIGIFTYLFILNNTVMYYDDNTYKSLSNIFIENGLLNFKKFGLENNYIRGYIFPWLIAIFQGLGGWYVWWGLTAVAVSLISIIVVPGIIKALFGINIHLWKRIIFCILFLIFYYGTIIYNLSDFWAASFAISGIYLIVLSSENIRKSILNVRLFAAGVLLYASYNTRTIYLFVIISIMLVLAFDIIKRRELFKGLLMMAILLVGIFFASLPQMAVNYFQHNKITPQVITGDGGGLFEAQLYWGIEIQKYESYVGEDYTPGLKYIDKVGTKILEQELNEEKSISNYINMVAKYPMDFMGIYFRHLINMLDMRYPEIYIKNIEPRALYPVINYSLLYFFLISFVNTIVINKIKLKDILYRGRYILVLLIPTILIVPGAVETRFAIMLHLFTISWLISNLKWKDIINLSLKKKFLLLIGYLCFFAVMCAIGGSTQVTLESVKTLY